MSEKEKLPEFSLEDILREFGSHPEEEDPAPASGEEPVDFGPDLIPIADEDRVPLEEEPLPVFRPERPDVSDKEPEPLSNFSGEVAEALKQVIGAAPAQPEPEASGTPAEAEPDEDVHIFTPKKSAPCAGGDTIRIDTDAVSRAASAATVRLDPEAVAALAGESGAAMTAETVRIDTDQVNAMTAETVRIDTDQVNAMTAETVRIDTDQVNAMTAETVRIDTDQVNAMTAETVRIDTDQVRAAAAGPDYDHVDAATTEAAPAAPVPEGAEPFSANWEPHYEEPIGEYIPPEPIVFRPHSRLQELKKKLVAGPERRYYALVEEGVGKLQVAIFVSMLIVILSAVSIGLNQMSLVQPERMRLLVFGELFAMLFSAVLASDLIVSGIGSLFRGRFTLHSLLAMSFFVCIADGLFCLRGVRVPYCAAFCLEVTMALWAEHQRRCTEIGQMDTLRKATTLVRIAKAPGCFEGRDGFYTEEGEVEDFMDSYNQTSRPEKILNAYALAAFLASACIGALAYVARRDLGYGLQMWSAAILSAAPATIFLAHSRPAAILERKLHRFGVVVCGWKGVLGACGSAVLPIRDSDLFPSGSIKINGVKLYSSKHDTDQIIAYTTALVERSGTVLAPLFRQMLDSRYGQHYEVENFRVYDNGGLSGEVCGDAVLVGAPDFLKEMGVRLPDAALVPHAVYTAINGELASVCAMAFGKLKGVSAGLATLASQRKLSPVPVTSNFLVTDEFIHEKFGVSTRRMIFPTCQQRAEIVLWNPDPEKRTICAVATQESLAATGFALSGARALAGALRHGNAVHMIGGIVGMLIVLVLQFVDGGSLLTPANLLLFELIWAIPGLLMTEWTRGL